MAYTINLDDEFISADELQLMKTKQAILEKLRAHFGEYSDRNDWRTARQTAVKAMPKEKKNLR